MERNEIERNELPPDPIAVRAEHLALLLGCSVRKIRETTPELPHNRHGGVVLFPVDAVRRHLNEKAADALRASKNKGF